MRKIYGMAAILLAGASLVAALGCGGGGDAGKDSGQAAAAPAAIDPATVGTIRGTVKIEGETPPNPKVSMDADPKCKSLHTEQVYADQIVRDNGHLQWSFVYVKSGLEGRSFPAPSTPVLLDQQGCHYKPHVFGVQVGQTLQIRNSDPTLHNVHTKGGANRELNFAQPKQGMVKDVTFKKTEIMVPFRCDVHSWMASYGGVVPHPFFDVSGEDGSFELNGLPPGDYVLEAWHEKFGTLTANVTLGASDTQEVDFTFQAG